MRPTSAGLALLALLAGCSTRLPESEFDQARRLRASYAMHLAGHLASIATEERLVSETLAWLNGTAVTAPRTQALREARHWMDRWAKVYFVPRYMHEQLRYDHYLSPRIKAVQRQLLDHMKQRYVELHDYQRYAQHASESNMHNTQPGRLPPQLVEFRQRLEVRAPAADRIGPLLATLAERPVGGLSFRLQCNRR
jgi:hypothetical protein